MPNVDGHTKPDETDVLTIHSRFLLQMKVEFLRPYQDFYLHNQLDKVLIILYIKDFFFFKLRILWDGGKKYIITEELCAQSL